MSVRNMTVRYGSILLLLALTLGVAGCGKKGAPQPPGPPSAVTYPRAYPAY